MKVKFQLKNKHYELMLEAIQFTTSIYTGDFSPIIILLSRDRKNGKSIIADIEDAKKEAEAFKLKSFPAFSQVKDVGDIINDEIPRLANLYNILKYMDVKEKKGWLNFSVELTEEDVETLCNAMDFYIRISLGQLQEVYGKMFNNKLASGELFYDAIFAGSAEYVDILMFESKILSDDFPPYYTVSYGINSDALPDSVRILYDLYKVMMYEKGVGGVYDYVPYTTSRTLPVLPKVEFPTKSFVLRDDNKPELFDFIDNINRDLIPESDKLYLRIEDKTNCYNVSILLETGDKIIKKYNGKYLVQKKERIDIR